MPPESPKTTVYLIRHAEPAEEFRDRMYGQMDVPLSERGERQTRDTAERLGAIRFDAIYSSDLRRAWVMAEALAEPLDLPVRKLESLRERSLGVLQGMTETEMRESYPEVYHGFAANRALHPVEGGETFEILQARVVPTLKELAQAFPGGRVAVATHAGPIRVALAHALGMPLGNVFQFNLDFACVTVLEFGVEGTPRVKLVNG